MMFKTYLAVMTGGAVGTGLRLWLSGLLAAKYGETFPEGTLVVNVLGSFVISFFAQLAGPDGPLLVSSLSRQVVMVGILGGFTTFSSFSFQTLNLLHDGQWARASANIVLSVGLCLFAAWDARTKVRAAMLDLYSAREFSALLTTEVALHQDAVTKLDAQVKAGVAPAFELI